MLKVVIFGAGQSGRMIKRLLNSKIDLILNRKGEKV